ncbi:MAG: threonylcarbamoyl-AMP synthase [Ignavibacteriae bacterium]|nr:threonylcarbamoyl-AMP synthase [Ignavibacteriota bacterium]
MARTLSVDHEAPALSVLGEAAACIRQGGVLVYPTETLYGIGADALNAAAIGRVVAAKRRQDDKPILVIVNGVEMLSGLVASVPKTAEVLMEEFWPGPLTIVFDVAPRVPAALTRGTGTIGVRVPSSTFCLELLKLCNCPLTSTSANVSGEAIKNTVSEIRAELGDAVDLYIDAGVLSAGKPSTVISVANQNIQFLREGVISFERIQEILYQVEK